MLDSQLPKTALAFKPEALSLEKLLDLVKTVLDKPKFIRKQKFQSRLRNVWNVNSSASKEALWLALSSRQFYAHLGSSGVPAPACVCLRLLYSGMEVGATDAISADLTRQAGQLAALLKKNTDQQAATPNIRGVRSLEFFAETDDKNWRTANPRRFSELNLDPAVFNNERAGLPIDVSELESIGLIASHTRTSLGPKPYSIKVVLKSATHKKVAVKQTATLDFSLSDVLAVKWPVVLNLVYTIDAAQPATEILKNDIPNDFSKALVKVRDNIYELWSRYCQELTQAELTSLANAIQAALQQGWWVDAVTPVVNVRDWLSSDTISLLQKVDTTQAKAIWQLNEYPQSFSLARSLGRRLHAKLGPTNSGKTWEALSALAAAPSGIYLAPLRLLAMEVRDRFLEQGIPCDLITGEERDLIPGARHIACTIEMLDPTQLWDVAVIDEIQMLESPDRGWAWTAALMGVAASDVYLCGSACVESALKKTADLLDESITVDVLVRKNGLVVEPLVSTTTSPSLTGGKTPLQPGDAVIGFSRRDILTLSARYRQEGWKVSTIYGALSPEIRRIEANKFSSGESDILVATDAIGMGLNLPIRRVIFGSVTKFDGVHSRELLATEVQQIAGRAGRFGLHDKGIVTTLDPGDLDFLREKLTEPLPIFNQRMTIAPNIWHLQALSAILGTQKIGVLLQFIASHLVDSSLFQPSAMEQLILIGHRIDSLIQEDVLLDEASISLETRFILTCAPVDLRPQELEFYLSCARAVLRNKLFELPVLPAWLRQQVARHAQTKMLEDAEILTKHISLYMWLSFKFPSVFTDGNKVANYKKTISQFIEKTLVTQQGFGLTSREKKQKRLGATAKRSE